jgi:hypothetical protein
MHVVLVARVGDEDSWRPVESGRVADEDHLGSGGDEPVEEILHEPVIDLVGRDCRAQGPVEPRVGSSRFWLVGRILPREWRTLKPG